jgi:hypothetical protein
MAWRSTAPSVSAERQEGARFARCRAGNLVPFDDDRPRAAPAAEIGDCGADHATAADHDALDRAHIAKVSSSASGFQGRACAHMFRGRPGKEYHER